MRTKAQIDADRARVFKALPSPRSGKHGKPVSAAHMKAKLDSKVEAAFVMEALRHWTRCGTVRTIGRSRSTQYYRPAE